MKNFELYLEKKGHTPTTIYTHTLIVSYFQTWATHHGIVDISLATINDVLEYVKYMQSNDIHVSTINNKLNSLKKYFTYQLEQGIIAKHPIRDLVIKGKPTRVVHNVLSVQELDELYQNYVLYRDEYVAFRHPKNHVPQEKREQATIRYKLVVSLMIYQGLHVGELNKLKKEDVDINKGTIYIPSTARSNSRVLTLQPHQLIFFYTYLSSLPSHQEKLIKLAVQRSIQTIVSELKGVNPKIKNAQHIRASVLINWIKIHGQRHSQYMIGHKYVSSTSRFEQQDTAELSKLLDTAHLFG
jgi:site-specific recombinase XerD